MLPDSPAPGIAPGQLQLAAVALAVGEGETVAVVTGGGGQGKNRGRIKAAGEQYHRLFPRVKCLFVHRANLIPQSAHRQYGCSGEIFVVEYSP